MIGKQISAEELGKIISSGLPPDSVVIDVRTEPEVARGKISGAINIPVDKIMSETNRLLPYKKIYLYCWSGGRSDLAAAQLSTLNLPIEIYSLTSGLLAWRKAGLPLVN